MEIAFLKEDREMFSLREDKMRNEKSQIKIYLTIISFQN